MFKKAVFPGKYIQGVHAMAELPATTLADIGLGDARREQLMATAYKACAPGQQRKAGRS